MCVGVLLVIFLMSLSNVFSMNKIDYKVYNKKEEKQQAGIGELARAL